MFSFVGDFSGAYREIPLREGESVDQVSVAEGDRQYQPGGCAELRCSSPPGTFGTTRTDDGIRIVWHYSGLTSSGASASTTGCAASPSPTTTSSTSTCRSGATNGRSGSTS